MDDNRLAPGQPAARRRLRVIGPTVTLVGLGFMIVGGVDLLPALRGGEVPRLLWCLWVGLPLVLAGAVITQFAFANKVADPATQESASAGNDRVGGAQGGTKTVVGAIGEPLREDDAAHGPYTAHQCHNCDAMVPAGARYCNKCGRAVLKARFCPNCGEFNDPRAKLCQNCQHRFQ